MTILGTQGIVTQASWRHIQHGAAVQQGTRFEHIKRSSLVFSVGRRSPLGRRTWIDPRRGRIIASMSEGQSVQPSDTDIGLHACGKRNAILGKRGIKGQWLPAIRIGASRNAETTGNTTL